MLSDEERKARDRERQRKRREIPLSQEERQRRNERRRALLRQQDPKQQEKDLLRRRKTYQTNSLSRARTLATNEAYRRRNWDAIKKKRNILRAQRVPIDGEFRARVQATRRRAAKRAQRRKLERRIADVYAAIPIGYPQHARDDIAAEVLLALADRRLKVQDVQASVSCFIREYWKQNSPYETVSLDAPIGDGATTYLDLLTEDQGLANFV